MLVGIVEFLGWFGAVTVLAGYLLFSLGKIPNGPLYQSLNLVGGLSVAVNVAAHHAVPSTIVNGIWAVIAGVVLLRTSRARTARTRATGLPTATVLPTTTVLHSEPPTTTAVLPVVGPALRDHEAEPGATDHAEPVLQADAPTSTGADAPTSTVADAPVSTGPAVSTGTGTVPVAPMTESVPVITATIALAIVAAAQHQVTRDGDPEPSQERDAAPVESGERATAQ